MAIIYVRVASTVLVSLQTLADGHCQTPTLLEASRFGGVAFLPGLQFQSEYRKLGVIHPAKCSSHGTTSVFVQLCSSQAFVGFQPRVDSTVFKWDFSPT